MGSYLPDKPITIEVIEEEYVPYTQIRYITGVMTIALVFISLWTTITATLLGVNYSRATYGYLFIPFMISFVLQNSYFTFLILIELAVIFSSIILLVLNSRLGIWGDFKERSMEFLTFSEIFTLGMALSLIIVMLLGDTGDNVEIDPIRLHMVVLDAPFFEELTFRFLWLIIPVSIITYYRSEKILKPNESPGFLEVLGRITFKGKDPLDVYDYLFIIISALFFGLSHFAYVYLDLETFKVTVEFSWGAWKIVQASLIGIMMGYLAIRGGLPFSLAFHWLVNALSSTILLLDELRQLYLLMIMGFLLLILIIVGIVVLAFTIVRLTQM